MISTIFRRQTLKSRPSIRIWNFEKHVCKLHQFKVHRQYRKAWTVPFRLQVIKMWKRDVFTIIKSAIRWLKKLSFSNLSKCPCTNKFRRHFSLEEVNNDSEYLPPFVSVHINKPDTNLLLVNNSNTDSVDSKRFIESNYTSRLENTFYRKTTCVINQHDSRVFFQQMPRKAVVVPDKTLFWTSWLSWPAVRIISNRLILELDHNHWQALKF